MMKKGIKLHEYSSSRRHLRRAQRTRDVMIVSALLAIAVFVWMVAR